MTLRSKLALSLAAAAMVITPMTPAFARSYGWGAPGYGAGWGAGGGNRWGGRPYRRDNTGAVIAAILGVGVIAAVAASANKSNQNRNDDRNRTYRNDDYRDNDSRYRNDDTRYRDDAYYNESRDYSSRAGNSRYESGTAAIGDEDAAVDACAMAARDEGSRNGYFAEVRDITETRRTGEGGYTVMGTLDQRSSYRANSSLPRAFSCSWSNGQASVRLS